MSAKGDTFYAWTKSSDIKGECGGAVISILKYALENKIVDMVLTVRKGVDIYDPLPVFITDPQSLHPVRVHYTAVPCFSRSLSRSTSTAQET